MSKIKSALALALITVVLLGLCFMCTVSFSYGTDNMYTFNSVISMMEKDSLLGGGLADGVNYVGGGYSAVFYPEGVISAQEYEDNLEELETASAEAAADKKDEAEKAVKEYKEKYTASESGSLYFETETVMEDGEISEEFGEKLSAACELMRSRLEQYRIEGARIDLRDGYTIEMYLPRLSGGQAVAFGYFSAMGEFTMAYGADEDSAQPLQLKTGETVRDYVKGARAMNNGTTSFVAISFTKKGRSTVAGWTSGAAETNGNLYFYVGERAVVSLPVSEAIDQSTLYISGSYTDDTARAVAVTIDTALKGTAPELTLTLGQATRLGASLGDLALPLLYAAFGVLFVGMMIFFFIRYRMLGFVQLYTFLIYFFPMVLCVWAVPMLHLGYETALAVLFGAALLSISQVMVYETAKKEFALGKNITVVVKTAYKKTFWHIFDLHIAVALLAVVTFLISLAELRVFALALTLAAVFSGLCALAVGRFLWAALMTFARNKGKFCNFRSEVQEDE